MRESPVRTRQKSAPRDQHGTAPVEHISPSIRTLRTYDILFEGHLRRGQTPAAAACSLLATGVLPKESIARAMTGFPVIVATRVSPEQAVAIRHLFNKAGALCKAVPADPEREQRILILPGGAKPERSPSKRRHPAGALAASGFAILVAVLVFGSQRQTVSPAPRAEPEPTKPVPVTPERVLTVLPGERQDVTLEFALPVVLDDKSALSLKTAVKVLQNEWAWFGVNARVVSQSIETFSVPVWFVREGSGSLTAPGVGPVSVPSGLPKTFDPARLGDLGVTASPEELISTGNLTETEFRSRLFAQGPTPPAVERSRLRIQRARVTVSIDAPRDRRFSGDDSSSRGILVGTDQYYVTSGAVGMALPVSWGIWLSLKTLRGEAGLFLLRPPDASWKLAL